MNYEKQLPSELELCKDEECETISIEDELEAIVQKIMSGGKFTITYGPVKFDLSISGNPNGLILKFSDKSKDTFETNFSGNVNIDGPNIGDVGSLKMTLDGSTSAYELMSKYEQFLQIYKRYEQGNLDMDNLIQDIILIFDEIAGTECIEDNCFQYGVCSEDLCNTQENFIEKANSGVNMKIAFILMALSLFFLLSYIN